MRRALVAVLAAALTLPAAAVAATQLKDPDASEFPRIKVTVVGSTATQNPPTLTENGKPVAGLTALNLGQAKSVMLAIDHSRSMNGKPLEDAIAAARGFLASKPPGDRVAVTTFATKPLLLTDFSTATIDADIALRSINVDPVQGTTLYDALVLSAGTLAAEPLPARVIIIVTDGNETRSTASLTEAIAAANRVGASVYVIAIESARFTPEPLEELATETGGAYFGAASSASLADAYTKVAEELRRTWLLEYVTAARPGERLSLEASIAGDSAKTSLTAPGERIVLGPENPSPLLPEIFYKSEWGAQLLSLAVGLLVLLACAFVFAAPRGSWLRGRLEPHVASGTRDIRRETQGGRLVFGAALFRATEHAFGNLRPWKKIDRMLMRADLSLKTAEFVYVMAGFSLLFGGVVAALGQPYWLVLLHLFEGACIPYVFVVYRGRKRLKDFESQLPDLLVTMAASLKAGHSFRQGVQSVVDEGQEPASKEFKRVLNETRLGRPMDDALGDMADRVGSKNFEFVMSAVTIQRQVGGSLAGLFDMVADTVRERHRFQRKIRGLTAMGRMSAYVLVGLPFLVFGAIYVVNRDYMEPLLTTSTGHKLILIALGMMAVGAAILKKIVSFKG